MINPSQKEHIGETVIDQTKIERAMKKLGVTNETPLEEICDVVAQIFAYGELLTCQLTGESKGTSRDNRLIAFLKAILEEPINQQGSLGCC